MRHVHLSIIHPVGLLCLLMALSLPGMPARSQDAANINTALKQAIHYTLTVPAPNDSSQNTSRFAQLHVTVTAPRLQAEAVEFAIPAWTPGYYQILHYETGIHNARAQDAEGRALPVVHPSERVWRVETSSVPPTSVQPITLSYDVDCREEGLGFFGSSLDLRNQHGYVNGASALMYPVGQTQVPCALTLDAPAGWQIATPMDTATASAPAPTGARDTIPNTPITRLQARTYDELIDCPLQMGKFETIEFQESGVQFQCIVVGRQAGSKEGVRDSLRRITHAAIAVFGNAPFSRYQFIYHIGGSGFFGGLEHHNSTVIHLETGLGSGTGEEFLTTTAHEFFHAWNVKRLRPDGLGPFDYTQSVRTSSLWFAEGVTDYYAQLLLARSGLKTRDWFWRDMLARIQLLDRTPARVRVTLRDASKRAWEGGSEGYDGLSYYLKGSLAGLYFDLRLRGLTHNQAGLDDVMRRLDAMYGAQNKAYPEDALAAAINAVAHQDLSAEYARLIESADEIDWNTALQYAGLQLQRDTAPFLGVRLNEQQGSGQPGALIETVEAGHAASRMGVKAGDRLLSVDGKTLSPGNFQAVIHALTPNSPASFLVQRGNETLTLNGVVGAIYEHHQLQPVPVGQLSPSQQVEAKALQAYLFSPAVAASIPASLIDGQAAQTKARPSDRERRQP